MSEQRKGEASQLLLKREIVVEVADLRVSEWTLNEGESLPWHHHSQVDDIFYCLQGTIEIEVDARHNAQHLVMRPGERYVVPSRTIHRVRNPGAGPGRFLLIEGVGKFDYIVDV